MIKSKKMSQKWIKDKRRRYHPLKGSELIVIDTHIQFGAPTITGTRINTSTIANFLKAAETINSLMNLYNITEQQIKDCAKYHNITTSK